MMDAALPRNRCGEKNSVSVPDQRQHELVGEGFVEVLRDLERLNKVEAPVERKRTSKINRSEAIRVNLNGRSIYVMTVNTENVGNARARPLS
jgi:hypothetical protein